MRIDTSLPKFARRLAVALLAASSMTLATSSAQAATDPWVTGGYLYWNGSGQDTGANPRDRVMLGSYCHELAGVGYTIDIGALNPNTTQYGSWVRYVTDGLRSYAGAYWLKGACHNPHSFGYYFNAHVNY